MLDVEIVCVRSIPMALQRRPHGCVIHLSLRPVPPSIRLFGKKRHRLAYDDYARALASKSPRLYISNKPLCGDGGKPLCRGGLETRGQHYGIGSEVRYFIFDVPASMDLSGPVCVLEQFPDCRFVRTL
jgi:hypothetical protein